MRKCLIFAVLVCAVAASGWARAQSPDERAGARDVIAKRGDAVITVLGSIKVRMSMAGREMPTSDETVQASATVLDASGLTVMALSAIEPEKMMSGILAQMSGGAGDPKMDMKTELAELRLRLADGKEVPARVVLRDADLDLVFLKPIDPPKSPMASVEGASAKPLPLDVLVMLQRLGESAGWKVSAAFGYVQAVLDKPRLAYLASGAGGLGVAAFDTTGRFVGVMVMRSTAVQAGSGMVSGLMASMRGTEGLGILPVIVPADDIREIAKQAAGK